MHKPRVLLVYKKDAFQHYVLERRDPHLRRLLRLGQRDIRALRRSHATHQRAIEIVLSCLHAADVHVDSAARADLLGTERYDLIVCVGGDGTFLQAARSLPAGPILGVNSDPEHSEAVFSAATTQTFPRYLDRALSGKLPQLLLCRLALRLNGRQLAQMAVNDVLLAHDNPATMSRYRLAIGGRVETQKSSGLWIATAAGSGSAVLAAGGKRLPWISRKFQYRPRELYLGRLSRPQLLGGVLRDKSTLRVTWLMRQGHVFVDGPHVSIPLRFADRLEIGICADWPVRVLGLKPKRGSRFPGSRAANS
jgi:NAD+ kinase